MTDENPITIGDLGGYTNNTMNREGIKKLVDKVNAGSGGGTTYTAGDNIQISAENVISATDTTYTAGDNVQISEQNVISATDTKYTAGTNVAISDQNVISATDTTYTAGTGISISDQNVISASGGSSNDWIECSSLNDIVTYYQDYEFLIQSKRVTYEDRMFLFNVPENATINSISDVYRYPFICVGSFNRQYGCIPLAATQGTGNYLGIYTLGSEVDSSAGSGTVQAYSLDGTVIDSTNVDTYIDSSYHCIKPFVVFVKGTGQISGTIFPDNSSTYSTYIFYERGGKVGCASLPLQNLKNAITNSTTFGLYSCCYEIKMAPINDSNTFTDINFKAYRRKKSKLPTPPTP